MSESSFTFCFRDYVVVCISLVLEVLKNPPPFPACTMAS